MEFYNLKHPSERVGFAEAARRGMGSEQGLFFPESLPHMDSASLAKLSRHDRYAAILAPFISDAFDATTIRDMVEAAFTFEAPVVRVGETFALELFHGPTLAFKDFGARFMAQCLSRLRGDGPMTILTATSGDTGAAVAHAFRGMGGVRVVVLYPKGRISRAQEQLFCTLGGNIETLAVRGSFDDCQAMVKTAFDDKELRLGIGLNSANSINVSRLIAQVLYFWDLALAVGQNDLVVCVPSGNFGDLTAGLLAKAMGAPLGRFVAATNANDTVPRYLASGEWRPNPTIATSSNAMDVSRPNNWPRTERLLSDYGWNLEAISVSEDETRDAIKALYGLGYLGEPHGAVAYSALTRSLKHDEHGAFLCTAHPAKFSEAVESVIGRTIELPSAITQAFERPNLSKEINADMNAFKNYLRTATNAQ